MAVNSSTTMSDSLLQPMSIPTMISEAWPHFDFELWSINVLLFIETYISCAFGIVSLIVSFRELSEKRISLLGNMVKGFLHGETESMWVFWGGGCFNGKQSSRDGGGRFGFNCSLWSLIFKDCMHNRWSSWCELCQQSHVSIRQAWLCLFDQCSSGMLWMWKKLPYVALLAWGLKSASVLCTLFWYGGGHTDAAAKSF